jgi:hypothetical protein
MKTRPPAQAEHQRTHVADRFDHWRQTRTTPAEPIPHYLWEHAIVFTTGFSIARVATRLRVRGGELTKRGVAHHAARSPPASPALGCVAVPAAPVWPLPTSAIAIARQRLDGPRLRIAAQEPQCPLLAVVRAGVETPGGSS